MFVLKALEGTGTCNIGLKIQEYHWLEIKLAICYYNNNTVSRRKINEAQSDMDKLKHDYNAFPELQTKFFHKQCVIWSFLPSFKEFHHSFHISSTINSEEKVTTSGISH